MNTANGNFAEKSIDFNNATLKVNVKGNETEVPLAAVKSYKSYVAFLTQSGSNAPVATVLRNDFESNFEWVYAAAGVYYLHSFSNVFKVDKIACFTTTSPNSALLLATMGVNPGDPTGYLTLKTYGTSLATSVDGWIGYVEVRVY